MSFYNIAPDIGHLANTHIAQYSHNINHAFHAMQEIGTSLADKAMYNPVTLYANELYMQNFLPSLNAGPKEIIGLAALFIGLPIIFIGIPYIIYKNRSRRYGSGASRIRDKPRDL